MEVLTTIAELRRLAHTVHYRGETIGFAPTMGALHEGHLSLVEIANAKANISLVSIFVNPAQFAPHEDFDRYPRNTKHDLDMLEAAGVDYVYLPEASSMYPAPFLTRLHVDKITEGLCTVTRPHFFDGVAIVVAKLLIQTQADIAIFGEKDYQQLMVIKQLAKDLDIPVEVLGAPIIREADGLALSSRNRYLNERERHIAPALYQTLSETATSIRQSPDQVAMIIAEAKRTLSSRGFTNVDYLEARSSTTLEPITRHAGDTRLFAAAYLGNCRLIDNLAC